MSVELDAQLHFLREAPLSYGFVLLYNCLSNPPLTFSHTTPRGVVQSLINSINTPSRRVAIKYCTTNRDERANERASANMPSQVWVFWLKWISAIYPHPSNNRFDATARRSGLCCTVFIVTLWKMCNAMWTVSMGRVTYSWCGQKCSNRTGENTVRLLYGAQKEIYSLRVDDHRNSRNRMKSHMFSACLWSLCSLWRNYRN